MHLSCKTRLGIYLTENEDSSLAQCSLHKCSINGSQHYRWEGWKSTFEIWQEKWPRFSPRITPIANILVWISIRYSSSQLLQELEFPEFKGAPWRQEFWAHEKLDKGSDDERLKPGLAAHPNHYHTALGYTIQHYQAHYAQDLLKPTSSKPWNSRKAAKNTDWEIRQPLIVQNYSGLPFRLLSFYKRLNR